FEDWDESGKAHLIYAPGGQMFWDSGNHGSSTMNVNVTKRSEEKKHEGNSSAKLNSQFVGVGIAGKFAAGNIFIGEYLDTKGTDGVLGWGRPWSSRPTAVTAWVHYTPKKIDNVNGKKNTTSGSLTDKSGKVVATINDGDMDAAIIYVAILDDHTESYNGKNYPVIIKTASKDFFDKDSEHVIAYGEVILDKATEGDAMVQVRIPLTYKSNKKASNIMLTAAASRYGDYFTGGDGSVLYLDDIQLEY
ncbi:MAG: PCMD domain-containing protein, partial [Muribaculaceae bacterium]|nr:PCMD domain-containing protein [Muribaculaceae bacterium]